MRSFNHKVIQLVNYRLKSKVAAHRLTLTQDNCITAPPGNTIALTPFIHITIRANSMLDLLTKGVQVARIGHRVGGRERKKSLYCNGSFKSDQLMN